MSETRIPQKTSADTTTIERIRANFPPELLHLDQWVTWRIETRDGKPTKVPYNAATGNLAKTNKPTTWSSFAYAADAYLAGTYAGVGFVFSEHDPFTGADFDNCIDAAGTVDPDKLATIRQLDSYTERSQSRRGVHVIVRAQLPGPGRNNQKLGREIYDRGRFFVVTGDVMDGYPTTIEDRQEAVAAYYTDARYFEQKASAQVPPPAPPRQETTLDDRDLLDRMFAAANGAKLQSLWDGSSTEFNGDESAGDLALCDALAFWTGRDAARMDRLFRQSGRNRDKWDRAARSGETYGQGTIQRAIDGTTEVYTPRRPSNNGHQVDADPPEDAGAEPVIRPSNHKQSDKKSAGTEPKAAKERRQNPTSAEYMSSLERLGYTFRMNCLDDTVEVSGVPISTGMAAEIRSRMRDIGYTSMDAVEDAYIAHAFRNSYHPVKAYLEGLHWNGGNHIGALALYFKDAHPVIKYADPKMGTATVFHAWLRRWSIGAVAKIYEAGSVRGQNPMLVLDGRQDLGKSTLVRFLGSPLAELMVEKAIQPDSKDDDRLLATRWIWEVSELGATTRRADREALKAFITRQEVTFRRPYDKHPVTKPALASFVGTLNNETGFLTDTTGNRRFLSVTLTDIARDYITRIDPNDVWAHAVALYRQGEPWQLLPEEKVMRDRLNAGYEVESAYEGYVLKFYDISDDPEGCEREKLGAWFVTTADVAAKLQTYGVTGSTLAIQRDVTSTLRALGLRPAREHGARGARGFWGISLKAEYAK